MRTAMAEILNELGIGEAVLIAILIVSTSFLAWIALCILLADRLARGRATHDRILSYLNALKGRDEPTMAVRCLAKLRAFDFGQLDWIKDLFRVLQEASEVD